jgi:hypothetical protein
MTEKAMSQAFDAIHDEATKLLKQSPPEPIETGLRLIESIARYQHDVRTNTEKGADPSAESAPDPEDNLSFGEAYDELTKWTRSLLRVVEGGRGEIEEILTGVSALPKGCPSHGSLAALAYRDVHKKLSEVVGLTNIVREKILRGGKV